MLTCFGERLSRVLRKASQPYHGEEGSQGGEYGGSTRRLERRTKPLNTSRTSSVLFSSRVMLLCRAHIVSSQRRYFSLSFTGSPARTHFCPINRCGPCPDFLRLGTPFQAYQQTALSQPPSPLSWADGAEILHHRPIQARSTLRMLVRGLLRRFPALLRSGKLSEESHSLLTVGVEPPVARSPRPQRLRLASPAPATPPP